MIDDINYELLKTLLIKPKYLHMGRSPMEVIERAWKMSDLGLISITSNGWLNITNMGKEAISKYERLQTKK